MVFVLTKVGATGRIPDDQVYMKHRGGSAQWPSSVAYASSPMWALLSGHAANSAEPACGCVEQQPRVLSLAQDLDWPPTFGGPPRLAMTAAAAGDASDTWAMQEEGKEARRWPSWVLPHRPSRARRSRSRAVGLAR